MAAYSASKGAIIALTRNMALDYAADNIRVNCLCPGFVETPLLAALPPERKARLAAAHPLGRLGTTDDVVPMALLLLCDEGRWITGQAIGIDGGFNAGHAGDY
jgi:NAD(P)-dependent dehydrogenase (short-subunit alcohol dehydrogenase family)